MGTVRKKLFSVGIADCNVQTFTVGGHGGSGKDTSNTGVRIVHPPSGAVGECQEERSQLTNKRIAMRRLGESKKFLVWARLRAAELQSGKSIDQLVDESMSPNNIKVEVRNSVGKWELWNLG